MPLTSRFYGGSPMGGGRIVQDFGLCDLKGAYVQTGKLRAKGLLVVVFFSPDSHGSTDVLKTVQAWTTETKTDKWTPVAVANSTPETLSKYAEQNGLSDLTFVLDYEYYQTRTWGVSHVPTLFLVAGKTGQVLKKIQGGGSSDLAGAKTELKAEVAKLVAAEEAAKAAAAKAAEEKAAAERKAAEEKSVKDLKLDKEGNPVAETVSKT